jgi:hypothetical protein
MFYFTILFICLCYGGVYKAELIVQMKDDFTFADFCCLYVLSSIPRVAVVCYYYFVRS